MIAAMMRTGSRVSSRKGEGVEAENKLSEEGKIREPRQNAEPEVRRGKWNEM